MKRQSRPKAAPAGPFPLDSAATDAPGATEARRAEESLPGTAGLSSGSLPALEMGYVVFMDVVGYSLLPSDHQAQLLDQLHDLVWATTTLHEARASKEIISLDLGDGVAFVFYRDPVAPLRCAMEVTQALKKFPGLQLRIGIHSGPVYRRADINENRNVVGGGVNQAQRVMDFGDAGHILLSRSVAEVLQELSEWAPYLHDLGEHEAKHGVRIHLFNFYTDEVGNPVLSRKLRSSRVHLSSGFWRAAASRPKATRRAKWLAIAAAVFFAALLLGGIAFWVTPGTNPPGPPETLPPDRLFSYSMVVQRYRGQEPWGTSFVIPGEMIFEADYRIRLLVSSPEPGYFYVLNEGPPQEAATPSFHVLFPAAEESAVLPANQAVRVPAEEENWLLFDEQEGTEKLWLIWAVRPVEELEAVRRFAGTEHQGVIDDPAEIHRVRTFLNQQQAAPPAAERDDGSRQTNVRGKSDILVRLVKLEHH
ncbi:MAG: hypothetical protein A3J28_02220 [Acidobacteria bacterium RIFCSPLOWO2_12_FULL_60_22]|nr:MAG: hypothetical protein A3J28_02220 [Acidobacteria bacterium RIFCSPLOWO2_12_FULL_60_22]